MQSTTKIGINGFGRIGRVALRTTFDVPTAVTVVHINDPFTPPAAMATLLNSDSAHGRFRHVASACPDTGRLLIHERAPHGSAAPGALISAISTSAERDPALIPWAPSAAHVVVDCTGVFLTPETASKHLATHNKQSAVQKVVLSAPSKSPAIPMFVFGVNTANYKGEAVVSNASCTTNCLAPLVKAIHSRHPIKSGLMTTVHAITASQPVVDGVNARSSRIGFSGLQNIIPASTGAAKAVGKVLPEMEGRLTGMAMRVPTIDVSVVDLTFVFQDGKKGLADAIAAAEEAEQKEMRGVLKVDRTDSLTSAGVQGEPHSSLLDVGACMEIAGQDGSKMVKVVSWYDNEYGYSCRLMQLAELVGKA